MVFRVESNKRTASINQLFILNRRTQAPDRCFGLIKRAYKVNFISSLYKFARMVDCCSTTGVNKVQLVGTHDGQEIVPVYDWAAFLSEYFTKLPNIKKYHHFRFSTDEPGKVYFKEHRFSQERSLMFLKDPTVMPPLVLPCKLHPEGLSQERKQYLYREIRPFCKYGTEDLVAPAP